MSYAAFQGNDRYLVANKETVSNDKAPLDNDGGDTTTIGTLDPQQGFPVHTTTGQGGTDYGGSYVIDSATSKHRHGLDTDGSGETSDATVTLSSIYPLATFKTDSEGWWPGLPPAVGFTGNYTPDQNRAMHDFKADNFTFTQTDDSVDTDCGHTHSHEIEKLKYGWRVNKDPNGHLRFDEVFLPKDGSAIKHHVQTWDTKGATASPIDMPWTLDPIAVNNKAEGIYRVLAVELHATGQQDGGKGSLVPSNKTDGSGQKHFVVPKQPGGFVSITAVLAGQQEAGMDFDSLYEFVPMGSNATISSTSCQVKTDNPGEYTVQVRTKGSSQTVIASMNVWVVWATGSIVNSPLPVATLNHISSGINTLDGGSGGGAFLTLDQKYQFKFFINPSGITDNTADVPNLTGKKDPLGDSQLGGQSPYSTSPLSGGATLRWDVSRRVRYHFLNPGLIPYGKMTAGYGTIYQGEPQVALTTIPFPSTSIIGNDDSGVLDEDNNPYASTVKANVAHNIGEITSYDPPNCALADIGGAAGYTFEEDDIFEEFARLEVGNV